MDLKDYKLILNESKFFPRSSRINLVPFRTLRGPLCSKPVTGQELFFAVSYSKPALGFRCQMSEKFWRDSSRIPIEITIAKADSRITNESSLRFSFEILMCK